MEPVLRFNWIDAVAVILLIRIFYISVQKGFVVEFFKIFGTFVSLFFAYHFYTRITDFISPYIPFFSESSKSLLVFLLIFTFFYILARHIRIGIIILFKIEPHYVIERWFSLLFGLTRGLLVLGIMFFVLNMLNIGYIDRSLKKSLSYTYIIKTVPVSYKIAFNVYKVFNPEAKLVLNKKSETE